MKKSVPNSVIKEALKFQGMPEMLEHRKKTLRKHYGLNRWTNEIKARELCKLLIKRIDFDLCHLPLDEMIKLHKRIRAIRRKYPHFYGQ